MPEDEVTAFATPIPLRDKDSGPLPNPYTRLEAAWRVSERFRLLALLTSEQRARPDVTVLAGVLEHLTNDLHSALWGSLADCTRIMNAADLGTWGAGVGPLLWPPAD